MLERSELLLKIVCVALAAVVLYEVAHVVTRWNPLRKTSIPALPVLAEEADAQAEKQPTKQPSVRTANAASTNSAQVKAAAAATPNAPAATNSDTGSTNVAQTDKPGGISTSAAPEIQVAGANANAHHASEPETSGTNAPVARVETNVPAESSPAESPERVGTNSRQAAITDAGKTSQASLQTTSGANSNKPSAMAPSKLASGTAAHSARSVKAQPMSPTVRTQVDWVVQSELLAPVMHPLPMALLGIAGEYAFLRAPNGQTDIKKAGEEIGGIKLLRIGTNRVLVEETGQVKELMIFEGYGGQSLMPRNTDTKP